MHPEQAYLDLMQKIIEDGDQRMDRTGTGTRALFGAMLSFDLSDGTIPILTTKKVYWKTAIKEMLWHLTGTSNIRSLLEQNVKIWTDWPLKAYRDKTQSDISQSDFESKILADPEFARCHGDLGPVYGNQWRHWVAPDGRRIDQIANLISELRTKPASRRALFHGWNVADIADMALPPCHLLYQYSVSSDNHLNSLMFQRSCDLFLGAAFNFTGQAALQLMLAQQLDLKPGKMIWQTADVHLYLNHLEQAKEQISRTPRAFPRIQLARKPDNIDSYTIDDFVVTGYDPYPAIAAEVSV